MTALKHYWLLAWVIVLVPPMSQVGQMDADQRDPFLADTGNFDSAEHVADVVYEVFGPAGTIVTIDYLEDHSTSSTRAMVALPWRQEVMVTGSLVAVTVSKPSTPQKIQCRITVNGHMREEEEGSGPAGKLRCSLHST